MSEKPKHLPRLYPQWLIPVPVSSPSPSLWLHQCSRYFSVAVIKLPAEAACRRTGLSWPTVPEGESAVAEKAWHQASGAELRDHIQATSRKQGEETGSRLGL